MGACMSCLGLGREDSNSSPSDGSHLLGNDPYGQHNYGSMGSDPRDGIANESEDIRRQRDMLEQLCARTNKSLIDITHMTPQDEAEIQTFTIRFSNPTAEEESWIDMGAKETTWTEPRTEQVPLIYRFDDVQGRLSPPL